MGTIAQKINYTRTWVNDIELALQERGVDTSSLALEHYGEAIRTLSGGSGTGDPLADYDRINSFKINTYNNYSTSDWFNHNGDLITLDEVVEIIEYLNNSIDGTISKDTDSNSEIIEYSNLNVSDTTAYTIDEII